MVGGPANHPSPPVRDSDVQLPLVRDSKIPSELRLRVLRFFRRQDVHAYDEHKMLLELPFQERMDLLW